MLYSLNLHHYYFFFVQNVTGQVVLITGGGGGVGVNLARNFAKLNARVVIWDINAEGMYIPEQL